jgi:hypothetical protein
MNHTHSQRLENYLGSDVVNDLSASMRDWYGPPIAVGNIPGARIMAHAGGDFTGRMVGGQFASALDYQVDRLKLLSRRLRRRQAGKLNAGFASMSDLISEITVGGKRREFTFSKSGSTGVVGATNSLWGVGTQPAAGANGAVAPGGTVHVDSDTGAFAFANPAGGDTQHVLSGGFFGSVGSNCLLMYDRLFSVLKAPSSNTTQAVTGVPTRYQSTTVGAADSAEGNFLFMEATQALFAVVHNWTVCQYTDQAGNATITLPSVTGNSGNIAHRLDMPVGSWFAPLATGDTGIQRLTQMQCSAATLTGNLNFVIGHPLAWIPISLANQIVILDAINSAFGLARIFDDACLAFLEVAKGATTATNYSGTFVTGAG